MEAAQALERATAAGDAGRLDEARATLEAAARRVSGSAAGQEDYGRALLADLQVCRLGGRSRSVTVDHGRSRSILVTSIKFTVDNGQSRSIKVTVVQGSFSVSIGSVLVGCLVPLRLATD